MKFIKNKQNNVIKINNSVSRIDILKKSNFTYLKNSQIKFII